MSPNRQHIEQLLDQLAPHQLEAVAHLLEVMLDPVARKLANAPIEDEEISEEEEHAVAEAREWSKHHKAALYLAFQELGFDTAEIAARVGVDPREVRRLLDPRHPSKLTRAESILRDLGKTLTVSVA